MDENVELSSHKSDTTDSAICSSDRDAFWKTDSCIGNSSELFYSQSEGNECESEYQDSIFSSFKLRTSDVTVEESTINHKVLIINVYNSIVNMLMLIRFSLFMENSV